MAKCLIHMDVDGFDELERDLQDMVEGLTSEVLNEWAAKILESVKPGIPEDKRALVQLRFGPKVGKRFKIEFRSPPEYVKLVKEAINQFLPEMPITTQQVFQALLERM